MNNLFSKLRIGKGLNQSKGFTLVEVMVSVSLFIVILVACMASILSVFDANQKSKTLRSVMDNLNISMEEMTRAIRFGSNYHCGAGGTITAPLDCSGGGSNTLNFLAVDGTQISYTLLGGRIVRSINGGANTYLTSSDVNITNLTFRVYGSPHFNNGTDLFQPEVIIVVSGIVGTKAVSQSSFTLETTVSQRQFDSQ